MPGCNYHEAIKRAQRFGIILERLISPEGTLPVVGRSITYRTGSLQTLALLAWRHWLPKELPNGQVRSAMTAVIKRMFGDNHNFNEKGFLTLGFNGSQPDISDYYTNNGSLYMASLVSLPMLHSGQMLHCLGRRKKHGREKISRKTTLIIATIDNQYYTIVSIRTENYYSWSCVKMLAHPHFVYIIPQ